MLLPVQLGEGDAGSLGMRPVVIDRCHEIAIAQEADFDLG
jgi:hypothetical protein